MRSSRPDPGHLGHSWNVGRRRTVRRLSGTPGPALMLIGNLLQKRRPYPQGCSVRIATSRSLASPPWHSRQYRRHRGQLPGHARWPAQSVTHGDQSSWPQTCLGLPRNAHYPRRSITRACSTTPTLLHGLLKFAGSLQSAMARGAATACWTVGARPAVFPLKPKASITARVRRAGRSGSRGCAGSARGRRSARVPVPRASSRRTGRSTSCGPAGDRGRRR